MSQELDPNDRWHSEMKPTRGEDAYGPYSHDQSTVAVHTEAQVLAANGVIAPQSEGDQAHDLSVGEMETPQDAA